MFVLPYYSPAPVQLSTSGNRRQYWGGHLVCADSDCCGDTSSVLEEVSVLTQSVTLLASRLSLRKYRSLEVRYTRLQQGPVRFTFTAEGEMLDEDDTGANEDDKDEEMASFTSFPQPGTIGENESDS